jgi:hypothetical protein
VLPTDLECQVLLLLLLLVVVVVVFQVAALVSDLRCCSSSTRCMQYVSWMRLALLLLIVQ